MILIVSELQLIAATYVRECISGNLLSLLFAIIITQIKFDDVNFDIWES